MASKNKHDSNLPKGGEKRPPTSPDDIRDMQQHKKVNQNSSEKEGQTQDEISENLKAIRVSSSQESNSYVPVTTTPQQNGPRYRAASEFSWNGTWNKGTTDTVNIEILSFNGDDFKGSYKRPEAVYIWANVLGQDQGLLHGISFKAIPRRNFQIVYRLKEKICIDTAFSRDDFSYNRGERKPDGSYDIICGRIMGMRTRAPTTYQPRPPRPQAPTRVNLYGCDFDLSKEQIMNWITKFGEVINEPQGILDRDCPDLATGDMSLLVNLNKQIPSFLPMYGKKIRVAYRGMTTVCSNCFDVNHI